MKTVKKTSTFLLTIFVLLTFFPHGSVGQTAADTKAERAREAATKIGVGPKARVEVKLRDGRRLKGYLDTVGNDSLTLIRNGTTQPTTIAFAEVDELKRRGGLGTGAIIGIVAAGAGVAVLLGLLLERCRNEMGC
jgi:hypothetical protein